MVDRHGTDDTGAELVLRRPDVLLVEEPLEIRLDGERVATTMRTPGHDFELAVGFCHAEGWLSERTVAAVRYCATGTAMETAYNVVTVETAGVSSTSAVGASPRRPPRPRLGNVTSSCGWCGSDSIDALASRLARFDPDELDVSVVEGLMRLAARVAPFQELFSTTGGSHAAAVFDLSTGDAVVVREDIGRHNALDKCVGRLLLDGALPATDRGVWISGRASFEIVQKAWAAGVGLVVAVSAPSSLAVTTARAAGLTLVGFARSDHATVYVDGTAA